MLLFSSLRKLCFLYLIPSFSPFFSVDPWFPCPSVSFSHPLCGLLAVRLCIWVMLYTLWQSQLHVLPNNQFLSHTWCLGFPFVFSSHLKATKYSCSPERRLGVGLAAEGRMENSPFSTKNFTRPMSGRPTGREPCQENS